jgi:hypothetical protein
VPTTEVSNSVSKAGVGTLLPCAVAVSAVTKWVRSTAPVTSATLGAALVPVSVRAKPTQVFSFGMNRPMLRAPSIRCVLP